MMRFTFLTGSRFVDWNRIAPCIIITDDSGNRIETFTALRAYFLRKLWRA